MNLIRSLLLLLISSTHIFSQSDSVVCEQKQLGDALRKKGTLPKIRVAIPKKSIYIIVPVIGSTPATGFMLGAAVQQAIYMGLPEHTRISQASANVTFTSKDQFLVTVKSPAHPGSWKPRHATGHCAVQD